MLPTISLHIHCTQDMGSHGSFGEIKCIKLASVTATAFDPEVQRSTPGIGPTADDDTSIEAGMSGHQRGQGNEAGLLLSSYLETGMTEECCCRLNLLCSLLIHRVNTHHMLRTQDYRYSKGEGFC